MSWRPLLEVAVIVFWLINYKKIIADIDDEYCLYYCSSVYSAHDDGVAYSSLIPVQTPRQFRWLIHKFN